MTTHGYLGLVTKFEVFTLLLWEVPFSFSLSPRLLNSLLRREVLIICYVFTREIEIRSDQFSRAKGVQRVC